MPYRRDGEDRGEVGAIEGRAGSRRRRRPSIAPHITRLWQVADLVRTQIRLGVGKAFRRVGPRHRVGSQPALAVRSSVMYQRKNPVGGRHRPVYAGRSCGSR